MLHLIFHYNKGNQTRSASTKERMFFLSPGLEKQLEVFLISGVLLEGNTISGDVVQKTSLLIQGSSFFCLFVLFHVHLC